LAELEEMIAEFVELGRQLRHEFERVHEEETTGDRRTALTREIAELEATVAAKDALLERYALKIGRWEDTFAQLAREHEDTERNLSL
jgi:predicted phage gp36 major capsid-like protein